MNRKKVVIGAVLACICVALAVGYFNVNSHAEKASIVDCNMESQYSYGEEFVMPEGKISYKGEEKKADSKYVVFPSGKANESEKIVLSEKGKYEVVFKAKFNGIIVSAKKEFIVSKSLLDVQNKNSTAKIDEGKIKVNLATDDVFTYNEVLDLSESSTDSPLIDLELNPNAIGTADVTRFKIRLTDLYDENNYVTISVNNYPEAWANGVAYITAGAANQPQVGIENVDNPEKTSIKINDIYGYGAAVNFSLVGLPNTDLDTHLKLYFDYEERAFYADREAYSGGQQRIVVDLDDKNIFGDDIWSGFTSGKVKMSIFGTNYQAPTLNFMISTINGNSEFDDKGDVNAPLITIVSEYDLDKLPNALVGKPFKVFETQAVDVYDGKIDAVASVYYKYYSEKPVKMSLTDGKFTPNKEGKYVIEYTATDLSGNVATEFVEVQAIKGDGLQVELKDVATETNTGVPVKLLSSVDYANPSGNVKYSVKAKHKSTDEEIKIDKDTMEFIPMTDGEWEVVVTVKDYISTVKKTFDIKANHTTQPQVYDNVAVPKYFIVGATYDMPNSYGYDFTSGKGVKADMDLFVTENGSTEKQIEKGQYIPEKAGNVTLTYRLTVDGKTCERSYAATVVDIGYTGNLELAKMFVATNGNATAESSNTSITYNIGKDTKLDFVNYVQTKEFTFSFQVGEKNAYNRINIYLTDIISGKQVKLSYRKTADGTMFNVNDGSDVKVTSTFDDLNRNFALEFYNDRHLVSPDADINVEVKQFLDGSKFEGFTDSVALFAVEIEDVSGASQLIINNVNGHTMNSSRMDRFAPQILVETKAGDRGKGEKVELKGAFAYDVIDPISKMTLDVTDPDGKYVTDENGVVLDGTQDPTQDIVFNLNKYGDFTIRYVIADGRGTTDTYVYAITAKDVARPSIEIKNHKETAKKGATVKVAEVEVEDNISKECTVEVYVFDSDGVNVQVTDGAFEATKTGTYTVRYITFDENGNCAFASYEIVVK